MSKLRSPYIQPGNLQISTLSGLIGRWDMIGLTKIYLSRLKKFRKKRYIGSGIIIIDL